MIFDKSLFNGSQGRDEHEHCTSILNDKHFTSNTSNLFRLGGATCFGLH